MNDAIVFDGVTLWRRTQEELGYDLKRLIFNVVRRRFRPASKRRVLEDVSFRIRAGEKVGIIGANGSGKSTILKLTCGILKPTTGRITVRGAIAPLIELGAGFDADLSVEDNIVYNGILLGHRREEMKRRVDGILDFAELHEHRHVPLKALSSGMAARLGFAIATDVRPDILLVDEVLSVGDESFRHRSAERLQKIWNEHATIVLVSHDIGFVAEQCQRAIWIESGRLRAMGPAAEITRRYLSDVTQREAAASGKLPLSDNAVGYIDELRIEANRLHVRGWAVLPDSYRRGTRVVVLADGRLLGDASYGDVRPDVAANHGDGALLAGYHADLPAQGLAPGIHSITVALYDGDTGRYHPLPRTTTQVAPGISALIG